MKSMTLKAIVATAIFAVVSLPIRLAAQNTGNQNNGYTHVRYAVIVLSTLGGTAGVGNSVNNKGLVAGAANLTGDRTEHAALWQNGSITDLGTLGGPDSFVNSPVKNDSGEIAGFAETSTHDPLGEAFCLGVTFFGFQDGDTCLGFLWQDGVMAPLPLLEGGNNSQAYGVNNRGQVVGFAENGTQDPSCTSPQVLQVEAVVWEPKKGHIQRLPPLSGDPDAFGLAINDEGEVAGCSGICGNVGATSCRHAVVWKNGSPTDIGGLFNLAGAINIAAAINNRGQVLGSSVRQDGSSVRSFIWQNGAITDLGILPGNPLTFLGGINNNGQVVGHSCDETDTYCSAYLWQDGLMIDLNTLIPPGFPLKLYYAGDINDRGEIAGIAVDPINPITGASAAFLAIPCDDEHAGFEGCASLAVSTPAAAQASGQRTGVLLPESVRQHLKRRLGFGRSAVAPVKQQ